MSRDFTPLGVTYTLPDDMENGGYNTPTVPGAGGDELPMMFAPLLDTLQAAQTYLQTTSTTSHDVGTGSKVYTMAEEIPFVVGSYVTCAETATPTNLNHGIVTAVSGTSLTVNVLGVNGSGSSITAWTIALAGPEGPSGTGSLDIAGQTESTVASAEADFFVIHDDSAGGTRKVGKAKALANLAVSYLANGTDGELITWDASGSPATVSTGSSGQVLTSNGTGAAPTFQNAASGALTFIETKSLSSDANVTIDTLDASAYDSYVFEFINVVQSSAGGLQTHLSNDGGSSFKTDASDYQFVSSGYESGSNTEVVARSAGSSFIRAMVGIFDTEFGGTSSEPLNGTFRIFQPHESGKKTSGGWESSHFRSPAGDLVGERGHFCESAASQIDAVRFTAGAGTLTGTINVYGVKNS